MGELTLKTELDGDIGVLRLQGELRLELSRKVYDAGAALRTQGAKKLLLDMSGVTFMDSASLGSIIQLEAEAREAGEVLILFAPSARAERVLEHAGLEGRLVIVKTEAEARERIAQAN